MKQAFWRWRVRRWWQRFEALLTGPARAIPAALPAALPTVLPSRRPTLSGLPHLRGWGQAE